MAASESPLAADDYVVRYGLRGFRGALFGLLLWTALASMIAVRATGPSIPAAIALAIGEIGLLAACAAEVWRAARREIVFAVSQDGVYFGSGHAKDGQPPESVPWEQISAIELFTEKAPVRGIRSSHRCVGVRAIGEGPRGHHAGAVGRLPQSRAAGSMLELDRTRQSPEPGRMPGERLTYRRMSGWRVSRRKIVAVVGEYAPWVTVISE